MPDKLNKKPKSKIARHAPVKDFNELLKYVEKLYAPEDLDEIREIYKSLKSSGKQKAKLIRPIVPIKEWLESEYYLGAFAYDLFPYWKQVITDIIDYPKYNFDKEGNPININQVILTGSIGCLKTDTLYSTSKGFKTLPQLVVDGGSFDVQSSTTLEKAEVSPKHILGVKPTKKITLNNGTVLEGTLNHKIKVLRDGIIDWVQFDELTIGDILPQSRLKEQFGATDIGEDLAYLIGYILGDGHSSIGTKNRPNSSPLISVLINQYQNNYEKIYNTFTKYFGEPTISTKKTKNYLIDNLRKQSKEFLNLPYIESLANTSHNKFLNEYLLSFNEKSIGAVIRGLFDSDGHASDRGASVEYTSVSYILISQIKRILAAFGINSKLKEKYNNLKGKTSKSYRLIINGIRDLTLFKQYIGFDIDYKANILDAILNRTHKNQRIYLDGLLPILREHKEKYPKGTATRKHRHVTGALTQTHTNKQITERSFEYIKEHYDEWLRLNPTLTQFVDLDLYTTTITSIEDSEAEVGDIEVPTTHHYNLGGIISHNTGKSTAAVILLVRKIYELSCYENIAALFKLGSIARIAFAYLSVTREQAQNTGFAALQELIDQIPYFTEHFPRRGTLDSALIWPQERLFVMHGSVANHFIGMNLMGSILDEANFYGGGRQVEETGVTANSKVARLYTQIITRAESRFIIDGENKSLSILVSSSTNISSFTEERINQSINDPSTFIVSPALWDVKPNNYKRGKFLVYIGGDGFEPFVIKDLDDINRLLAANSQKELYGVTLEDAYTLLPENLKSKILKVPEEHKSAFLQDVVIALQDLGGISSAASRKFFTSHTAYNKCIDETIEHPFTKSEFKISTTKYSSEEGFLPISAYLKPNITFKDLSKPRYMHVDLATTGDSIGIAMVHITSWKTIHQQFAEEVEGQKEKSVLDRFASEYDPHGLNALFSKPSVDTDSMVVAEHRMPIIETDFILRLNPPAKPERMPISKVRDFILYLTSMGIKFGKITFDQWGSEQIRQELTELGYNVGLLSVDRTTEPYYTLANLFYEERMRTYHYPIFKEEFFSLVEDRIRKKLDHPLNGSKDTSDAMAGAVFNAITAEDKTDLGTENLADVFISSNTSSIKQRELEDLVDKLTKELEKSKFSY